VKEIESIGPKKERQRVVAKIQGLADDPRPPGSQKLSGQERYRVRQGEYRIVYGIDDAGLTVGVVKVGHRREVYR
jgi:mRNA interferase RelE/StbE